ncbi:OLC1v1010773C2 [Oldenlandia corymbosa var. corymbosa]|nr:OLC1v1010773C2 [Oldenlandia corymbosa var. corymbosa]
MALTSSSAAAVGGGRWTHQLVYCSNCTHLSNFPLSPPITTTSTKPLIINTSTLFSPLEDKSRLRLRPICKAADTPTQSTISDKSIVSDDEFSLAKVSFGVIGLGVGVSLLSYGFGAYFNILPGSEWSAIMLTYGFPLAIIGMALKYAELKPVPCLTYTDAQQLREKCATPILKQVRNDVIRYRYGDEQHLDEALKRIFQYGQGGGIPRRSAPVLQKIREEVTDDGKYCLVLIFEAKALQLSDFEQRQVSADSFFSFQSGIFFFLLLMNYNVVHHQIRFTPISSYLFINIMGGCQSPSFLILHHPCNCRQNLHHFSDLVSLQKL